MSVVLTCTCLQCPLKFIMKLRGRACNAAAASPAPRRRIVKLQHNLRAGLVTTVCTLGTIIKIIVGNGRNTCAHIHHQIQRNTDRQAWFCCCLLTKVWCCGGAVPLLLLGSISEEIQSSTFTWLELSSLLTLCLLLVGFHKLEVQ